MFVASLVGMLMGWIRGLASFSFIQLVRWSSAAWLGIEKKALGERLNLSAFIVTISRLGFAAVFERHVSQKGSGSREEGRLAGRCRELRTGWRGSWVRAALLNRFARFRSRLLIIFIGSFLPMCTKKSTSMVEGILWPVLSM